MVPMMKKHIMNAIGLALGAVAVALVVAVLVVLFDNFFYAMGWV